MTDIVERLRRTYAAPGAELRNPDGPEAADEIERLRACVAAARREALDEAANIALRIEVPEDAGPIDGHARVMASVQIAAAIRALLTEGER